MQPMTWEGRKGNTRRRLTSPCFSLYFSISLLLRSHRISHCYRELCKNWFHIQNRSKVFKRLCKTICCNGLRSDVCKFPYKIYDVHKKIDMKNKKTHTHIFQQMLSLWLKTSRSSTCSTTGALATSAASTIEVAGVPGITKPQFFM